MKHNEENQNSTITEQKTASNGVKLSNLIPTSTYTTLTFGYIRYDKNILNSSTFTNEQLHKLNV